MNNPSIPRHVAKQSDFLPSVNLFSSLVLPEMVQEQQSQFTSTLAHEIRSPLTSIGLAAQMLKTMISDNDQQTYLDIIIRNAGRIDDIVTDIVTPLHTDPVEWEEYHIHRLLDEVIILAEERISLKNIAVIKNFAAQDMKIAMNWSEMKIALTNIISNAIDAMPLENGQLKLVTQSINGNCVIEMEDNGTGISQKNMTTLFKPYFTKKPDSTGLGLSTTLDMLLRNHVRADVYSEAGKGTRFVLSFDRLPAAPEMYGA